MSNLSRKAKQDCEWFLNELERMPVDARAVAAELLGRMPELAQEHGVQCASCSAALQDLAETRKALEGMKEGMPEAGPWFVARVMAAIRAEEEEIEERKEGVWIGVRRLAPRVVAFAAVLLVLGGTWAIESRRAEQARRPVVRPAESLFEGPKSAPGNGDIVASAYEEQLP